MGNKSVFAAAVMLALSGGQAFAEGNNEPFGYRTVQPVVGARAFVSDTGSDAFPNLTGGAAQPSASALREPASGSEAPVQSAASLPTGFGMSSTAFVQSASAGR